MSTPEKKVSETEPKSPSGMSGGVVHAISSIIGNWKHEDVQKELEEESWNSKIWKKIAEVAGVSRPLGKADYDCLMKKCDGDVDRLNRDFMSHPEYYGPSVVLHADEAPFDFYRLMKFAHAYFIYGIVVGYLLILCVIFALLGRAGDCYDEDFTSIIPQGFLLVSGMRSFNVTGDYCVWIESLAIFTGVYFTIPVFTAVLLVRLLTPTHKSLRLSSRAILTKRDGKPVIMIRLMTSNGCVYTNINCHLWMVIRKKDAETGEGYGSYTELNMICPQVLDTCQNIVHSLDEESPIMKSGAIYMDPILNVPKWNAEKIVRVRLYASADSTHGGDTLVAVQSWFDIKHHLVDADIEGNLPVWKSGIVVFPTEFVKSEGRKTPMLNLANLSEVEYRVTLDVERRRAERKEEEEKEQSNFNKIDSIPEINIAAVKKEDARWSDQQK